MADDEFMDALWAAYDSATGATGAKSLADYHGPALLAVARVALERAAEVADALYADARSDEISRAIRALIPPEKELT